MNVGSPPRVRGKADKSTTYALTPGITPACAGKSFFIFIKSWLHRDHPRVGGEKPIRLENVQQRQGSPPRVRGKVSDRSIAFLLPRITPACAGKSWRTNIFPRSTKDHPRVCGEKAAGEKFVLPLSGSPPRVRGKVFRNCDTVCPTGITPACAGKRLKKSLKNKDF